MHCRQCPGWGSLCIRILRSLRVPSPGNISVNVLETVRPLPAPRLLSAIVIQRSLLTSGAHFVLTANTQSFLSAGSRVYHPEEYLTLSSLSSSILGRVPLILLSGNLIGFSNLPGLGPSRIWPREYIS